MSEKIYVIALEKRLADLPENIEVYSLGKENGNNGMMRFVKFNRYLAKTVLHKKVDIIFTHMCPEYALLAFPYAKIMGVPVVMWYSHGNVDIRLRLAHLLVDRVVASSRHGFRLQSNKLTIVGQGIDVEQFKPKASIPAHPDGKKTVLSAGRISPVKDYKTLIESVGILINRKRIKGLEFKIAGGAPLRQEDAYLSSLKDMVGKYRLEDHVHFTGPIPHSRIEGYYQSCDLFISASNTGSLDKAVLEAMACGKIVLTSNEAFKEVFDVHADRLMFAKGNAEGLAQQIDSLSKMDEAGRKQLGEQLRDSVVRGHSLDALTDKLVDVFESLVAKGCLR